MSGRMIPQGAWGVFVVWTACKTGRGEIGGEGCLVLGGGGQKKKKKIWTSQYFISIIPPSLATHNLRNTIARENINKIDLELPN